MTDQLHCPADARRDRAREAGLNGIDWLEVLVSKRTLLVHCFRTIPQLSAANVRIEGGVRVRDVRVEWAARADFVPPGRLRPAEQARLADLEDPDHVLVVRADSSGDFSTYTLRVLESAASHEDPPAGFDPRLSSIGFSFKVDCPSDFDCAQEDDCELPELSSPQIDYMAKDYASFRRLMLDRLSVITPDWKERNPADLMVTLVEVLAYAGDSLSYWQDAVATEAYLGTARRRASVRRHARLVDYHVHDGANARTWVCVEAGAAADGEVLPEGTMVLTGETESSTTLGSRDVDAAVSRGALVFETLHPLELRERRDAIRIHTWGDPRCCIPAGATRATLVGSAADLRLREGDVLVFEEVLGLPSAEEAAGISAPRTGRPEDADPAHRHAVRLCREPVERTDPIGQVEVLEVEWDAADALPFPLCAWDLGSREEPRPVSLVRGNVALADHGRRVVNEELEPVPDVRRFRPVLERAGLTHAAPYDDEDARLEPAAAVAAPDPRSALPWIFLRGEGERWEPERELLNSDRFATSFVVEMHEDGRAGLRFGDNVLGRRPAPGEPFRASYRVGSGQSGNVGAGALSRVVTGAPVLRVWNPMPAVGGADPEPIDQVRLYAPQAFRSQRRAVTAADYATVAESHPEVQKAAAARRWTGSWYTIFVTIDRRGGGEVDAAFERRMRAFLDGYRLAGYDLEIAPPQYVALDVELSGCVAPGYVRGDVRRALEEVFSNRRLRDGTLGFFHPDNFTFGQPVYLSRLIAAAMSVPGVDWIEATRFHRFREAPRTELADGKIAFAPLEIARLDNDPNRPEHGRIAFDLRGGT
jgi:baseplate J-like protein